MAMVMPVANPATYDSNSDNNFAKQSKLIELCYLSAGGNLSGLQNLVASADFDIVNAYDYDRRTPLHLAASEGQLPIVKYLVEHGARVSAKDRWNNTPLQDSIREGHLHVSQYLIHQTYITENHNNNNNDTNNNAVISNNNNNNNSNSVNQLQMVQTLSNRFIPTFNANLNLNNSNNNNTLNVNKQGNYNNGSSVLGKRYHYNYIDNVTKTNYNYYETKRSYILSLPGSLLISIIQYLYLFDILNINSVCNQFYNAIMSNTKLIYDLIIIKPISIQQWNQLYIQNIQKLQNMAALLLNFGDNTSNTQLITDYDVTTVLHNCQYLHTINLSNCSNVTDNAFKNINKLSILKHIYLSQCTSLTDTAIYYLNNNKLVESLDISYNNNITNVSVSCLRLFHPKLKHLNVSFCNNTRFQPVQILAYSHHNTNATDNIILNHIIDDVNNIARNLGDSLHIANPNSLIIEDISIESLLFNGCDFINDSTFLQLTVNKSFINNLTLLNIRECTKITDASINYLCTTIDIYNNKLTNLDISDCSLLTDYSINNITNRLVNLNSVSIWNLNLTTNKSLYYFNVNNLTNIKVLKISSNSNINDNGLNYLIHFDNLTELDLIELINITDNGIHNLITNGKFKSKLLKLNLSRCRLLTSTSLNVIRNHCISLMKFDCSWINDVNDNTVIQLLKSLTNLTVLEVRWCNNITNDTLLYIIHSNRKLQLLDIRYCKQMSIHLINQLRKSQPLCIVDFINTSNNNSSNSSDNNSDNDNDGSTMNDTNNNSEDEQIMNELNDNI